MLDYVNSMFPLNKILEIQKGMLNKQQKTAYELCTSLYHKEVGIIGAGGVGKTHTVNKIIQHFIENNISFSVGAFTHQAVSNIDYKGARTLASLLGLKPSINTQATSLGDIETLVIDDVTVSEVIICDEYSMIPQLYVKLLRKFYKHIIWVGDNKQLPPIKSEMLNLNELPTVELIEPMRQGSQTALFKACSLIRNDHDLIDILPMIDNISIFTYHTVDKALDVFKTGDVFLAYSNAEVKKLANKITNRVNFISSDIVKTGNSTEEIKNGEILTIESIRKLHEDEKFGKEFIDKHLYMIKYVGIPSSIITFCGGLKEYRSILNKLNQKIVKMNREAPKGMKAKEAIKLGTHPTMNKSSWKIFWTKYFYPFKNVLAIQHQTSSTVHKMQGSQAKRVFILADGFKGNNAESLFYTAITRAEQELHIVTSQGGKNV